MCTICASSSRRAKATGVLVAVATRSARASRCSRRRASSAPTSCSATRSASACRWATAVRTPRSSRRSKRTCDRRRAASSACRWTRTATPRIACRCRRASSTSAARRRRRTSARRRRCWPTSPASTPSITGRRASRRSRGASTRSAQLLERELKALGVRQLNDVYFDTLRLEIPDGGAERVRQAALSAGLNFRYRADGTINVALDETTDRRRHRSDRERVRRGGRGQPAAHDDQPLAGRASRSDYPTGLARTSPFLTHPVFNTHHSETQMMRYIRSLERKDVGLDTSMIPLGSCTMKLNAASEMLPITWPEFSKLHPFVAGRSGAGVSADLPRARGGACARSPASPRCRCSRTPARRASSPG